MSDNTTALAVRDLRRRWKPHKDRLCTERPDHPTTVRFHRACSWLADPKEYKQFRDRVQRVVCRLNARLAKGGIPREMRPLSKYECDLIPAGG